MNAREIQNVAQVMRSTWVHAGEYVKCYKDIAQAILDTHADLPDFWREGLEAIVRNSEVGYVAWGRKWNVVYTFENDVEVQNWYYAYAAMSCEKLSYYLLAYEG